MTKKNKKLSTLFAGSSRPLKGKANEKFTQKQVIDALSQAHGVQTLAAELLGCSRATVGNYISRYPAVKKAADEAPERITDIAEGHVIKAVIRGSQEDVRWWLKTRGRSRGYADVVKTELTGKDGAPLLLPHYIPSSTIAEAMQILEAVSGNGHSSGL
jgi:predicted transcriptional regulator